MIRLLVPSDLSVAFQSDCGHGCHVANGRPIKGQYHGFLDAHTRAFQQPLPRLGRALFVRKVEPSCVINVERVADTAVSCAWTELAEGGQPDVSSKFDSNAEVWSLLAHRCNLEESRTRRRHIILVQFRLSQDASVSENQIDRRTLRETSTRRTMKSVCRVSNVLNTLSSAVWTCGGFQTKRVTNAVIIPAESFPHTNPKGA